MIKRLAVAVKAMCSNTLHFPDKPLYINRRNTVGRNSCIVDNGETPESLQQSETERYRLQPGTKQQQREKFVVENRWW